MAPEGARTLLSLAARADVVLESLAPGALAALGAAAESMRADNPAVVVASITPYGQTGPMSGYVATDLTMFASSGSMYRQGLPDREPLRYAGHMPRTFPGVLAADMVVAALWRRRQTGLGDWIDIAEVDCWAAHPNQITRRLNFAFSGDIEEREDTKQSASASAAGFGRGNYRCLDGYVTFNPLGDRHWPRLVEVVGRPELLEDPRFATREARRINRPAWEAIWEGWIAARTVTEVFATAQRAGIPSGPLLDAEGLLADPHLRERDYFQTVEHARVGRVEYPGPIARGGDAFWALRKAAPFLSADTERVLAELAAAPAQTATFMGADPGQVSRPRQPLPLAGLRVVEIAEIWAGPWCGAMLGDLGAEVIKVEAIQRSGRGAVRPLPGASGYPNGDPGDEPWNRSAGFLALNRNKLDVTLDLHTPQGQALLDRLLARADIVFTNLSVDAQESLNLLPTRFHAANPRLIAVLLTGFGLTGPYRYYRSMGMTLDAASGHSTLRGYPDLDYSELTPVHHPDGIAAATALYHCLLGLEQRAQTGEGQIFDLSQHEAAITHLGEYVVDFQLSGESAPRLGNDHQWMAPHGCFEAAEDDTWVAVAVDTDDRFERLARAIGHLDLLGRPELATIDGRHAHANELNVVVADWVRGRGRFEAEQELQAAGVPAAAVLRPDVDQLGHPHFVGRGVMESATFDGLGPYYYPRGPWHFVDTEPIAFRAVPSLGQHNGEVLGGLLGLSERELAELEATRVIGTRPLEGADAPVAVRRH